MIRMKEASVRVSEEDVRRMIAEECDRIKEMLLQKNEAYGNSALDPVRVFSKASTLEQLNVRIDDKLSRVARGHEHAFGENLTDLIGYLVLRAIKVRSLGAGPPSVSQPLPPDPGGV